MNKVIRIGVLGAAAIAERSVIPAIKELDEHFELVAIASRSMDKAQTLAEKYNCEAIEGYQNLVQREDIDALYLPLPSGLLHEWIPKALHAGKHIYAEKSIALNLQTCSSMVQMAKEKHCALMEGFMFQYHSQHRLVQQLINDGSIGEIRNFSASFGFPPLSEDNFRYDSNLGGGALFDAGAYPVRAAFMLLGKDLKVSGSSLKRNPNGATEYGSAYLSSPNGVGASIAFGFDNYYQCNYSFWGSKGKLTAERAFTPGPQMKPLIKVETQEGIKEIVAEADNHFIKAFMEFHEICMLSDKRERHYEEILQQGQALSEINKFM